MSSSYQIINYYYRPNKQVERKIIIDILQSCRVSLPIHNYLYLGMGSIYYYDFILVHKFLGIKDLISIDYIDSVQRFKFNKPYDFIKFRNQTTTDFLSGFEFKNRHSIFWLDYDKGFVNNQYLIDDLKIISKRAYNDNFLIITINSTPPSKPEEKKVFIHDNKTYLDEEFQHLSFVTNKNFKFLIQNYLLNFIKTFNEHSDYSFHKIFSFHYKDGAPMYTLGGVFTDDIEKYNEISNINNKFNGSHLDICDINVPKVTYKEKFQLDSKIDELQRLLSDQEMGEKEIENQIKDILNFELNKSEVKNYLENYKYIPQYYEGII